MGWEMGGEFRTEGHVYLWLIRVDVWQRPTEYCRTIVLQSLHFILYFSIVYNDNHG